MRLEGKVAVITGAASGIGRSMARCFAAQGALVVAVDIDATGLDKVVAELGCEGVVADISDSAGLEAIVDRPVIDILCNNAGVLDRLTPLLDVDDAMWERVMTINVKAPFQLCKSVLPGMIERGGGVIVNTCSAAALSGGRAGCAYTVSKHGLLGLTRSIAWFYGSEGIRCNAIAPGAIQTKMHMREVPHQAGIEKYSPYFPTIPQHGKAMAVAETALFLASDAASYVNGEILSVDGGWNAF
jgi:NAD(P)-dependent dehydrogenase (short-subunit alcohol dehydrogenase family)